MMAECNLVLEKLLFRQIIKKRISVSIQKGCLHAQKIAITMRIKKNFNATQIGVFGLW